MKKYLFGLFAVALAVGFSAFSTKQLPKGKFLNTFYSIADNAQGTQFHWTADINDLDGLACASGSATCAISTNESLPADNTFPAVYTPVTGSDKNSVYR